MTVMYFDNSGFINTIVANKIEFLYNSILVKRHDQNPIFIDYKNVINVTGVQCEKCSYNPTYGSGEWNKCFDEHDYFIGYKCSKCNGVFKGLFNYCPDCGAHMRKGADNEKIS